MRLRPQAIIVDKEVYIKRDWMMWLYIGFIFIGGFLMGFGIK